MGGDSMGKVVCFCYVILSGAVLSSAVINITMLMYPESNKKIMVGENLELEWKFNTSRMAGKKWSVSLYLYNFTDSSKGNIVRRFESGEIVRSPEIPREIFQRLNYSLSVSYAKLLRRNTNFDDSAGYGISFESDSSEKSFEKVTEVLIVDMLSDEEESSNIVKTWIGHEVELICSIFLKVGADAPTFTWIDEEKNITIIENISVAKTKSVLTMSPQDGDDFGDYLCRATTAHTKIKYNITLIKIEYPGYPLYIEFSPSKRSLSWMAPIHGKDGSSTSFIVQYHDEEISEWVTVNRTMGTSITLSELPIFPTGNVIQACNVRVCSTNKKGSENRSCSESRIFTSNYSNPPFVNITRDSTGNAVLSWETQPEENIPILEYVIHIINKSNDYEKTKLRSMHLDYKMDKEKYIFRNLEESIMFRVCIRNSLCLYEKSCSNEVGLNTVYPSEPRSVRINYMSSHGVKLSWKQPLTKGNGPLKYIVEIKKLGNGRWMALNFTKKLHIMLKSAKLRDHIRVCVENNAGRTNQSCSRSLDLNEETLPGWRVTNEGTTCTSDNVVYKLVIVLNASILLFMRQ